MWATWLALAALFCLSVLPSAASSRAGELAGCGRLVVRGGALPGARWARQLPWHWVLAAACVAAVAVVGARGGVFLAVPAAAVLATSVVLVRDGFGRRATAARHRDLSTAIRVLVGELETGAQAGAALSAAAASDPRVAEAFGSAARVAMRGGDVGAVLAEADDPDVRVIGLAWRLGDATGAALAGVLGRVAADLAEADEQRRTVAVALAGPRSSAAVLSGLPVLGIALGAAMGARPLPFLTGVPAGRALCCAGVLLDVAGVLWMRRIVLRAERP